MITYYDRQGRELHPENALLRLADPDYRLVAYDPVGVYRVSTVWLGMDHGWSRSPGDPPIIFETMVFTEVEDEKDEEHYEEAYPMADHIRRYATEEEALMGHAEVMQMCEEA